MRQKKALNPHEIRVIKLAKYAILDLIWEILIDISYKKFLLPHNTYYTKKISFDWWFDEEQCEYFLLAHRRSDEINKEKVIALAKKLLIKPIESLLTASKKKAYYSIQDISLVRSHSSLFGIKKTFGKDIEREKLLAGLGIRVRPLKRHEVRIIWLSKQAITELLWEHFMDVGDQIMDLPKDKDDVQTIYHMNIRGALEELTLYVMNVDEASDEAFVNNLAYCDRNINCTFDSYSDISVERSNYVSVIIGEKGNGAAAP